jgi:hypothetical protein
MWMLYEQQMVWSLQVGAFPPVPDLYIQNVLKKLFLKVPGFLVLFKTQIFNYNLFVHRTQRYNDQLGLFKITRAAITPGTQPQRVSKKTITKEPQPFPITDKGGNKMASSTLMRLIVTDFD